METACWHSESNGTSRCLHVLPASLRVSGLSKGFDVQSGKRSIDPFRGFSDFVWHFAFAWQVCSDVAHDRGAHGLNLFLWLAPWFVASRASCLAVSSTLFSSDTSTESDTRCFRVLAKPFPGASPIPRTCCPDCWWGCRGEGMAPLLLARKNDLPL